MTHIFEPLEIMNNDGSGSGTYRMTKRSDERPNDPPEGLCEHRHSSKERARECEQARERMPCYLLEDTPPYQDAEPMLRWFQQYQQLPDYLQGVSKPFCELAHHVATCIPRNAERTVALRKLLEATDAAVRAAQPPPKPIDLKPS